MRVRRYADADWSEWLRMSLALFPDESQEEIERSMRSTLRNPHAAVLIAVRDDGSPCGEHSSQPPKIGRALRAIVRSGRMRCSTTS